MSGSQRLARALLLAAAFGAVAPGAADAGLLVNGGFETGDFTGWTVVDRPLGDPYDPGVAAAGTFVVDGDGATDFSGLPALGPNGGAFYAISDMTAQGTHVLLQGFTVPLGALTVTLSFDQYVYDWFGGGGSVDPAGLDHTTAGPNQHARVDLLSAGATPFDTGAGVLANFYLGVDPEAALGQAPVYRSYVFDLTALALPGMSYQLRFGEVDNLFVLNQAVDNVRVDVTASPVPEPSTWVFVVGAVPLALIGLRRRACP